MIACVDAMCARRKTFTMWRAYGNASSSRRRVIDGRFVVRDMTQINRNNIVCGGDCAAAPTKFTESTQRTHTHTDAHTRISHKHSPVNNSLTCGNI